MFIQSVHSSLESQSHSPVTTPQGVDPQGVGHHFQLQVHLWVGFPQVEPHLDHLVAHLAHLAHPAHPAHLL